MLSHNDTKKPGGWDHFYFIVYKAGSQQLTQMLPPMWQGDGGPPV